VRRRIAVALATILVAGAAAACSDPPAEPPTATAAAPPTTSTASAGKVTITLRAVGCRDCAITAYATLDGKVRSLGERLTSQGFPSWALRASQTKGMAFTVADLSTSSTSRARTAIVMQYQGIKPGSPMNDARASKQTRGTYCWGGAKSSTLMTVKVGKAKDSSDDAPRLLAYADLMRSGYGDYLRATDGVLTVTRDPRCPAR